MADYYSQDMGVQSTGGMTPDPTTGGYTDQYGNKYDAQGNLVQQQAVQPVAKSQPSQVSPSGGGGMSNTGATVGAAAGTAVGGPVGGAVGSGVGAVGGALLGGMDDGKSDEQRIKERVMNKKLEAQRGLYNNRGADEVIGSIAQPGGPVVDMARARITKGEPLTPEERKAVLMGGYGTVSQGAAREDAIYQNELKRMQRQQVFGNLARAALLPVGLAVGINLFRKV